jgi:hypothetical protein
LAHETTLTLTPPQHEQPAPKKKQTGGKRRRVSSPASSDAEEEEAACAAQLLAELAGADGGPSAAGGVQAVSGRRSQRQGAGANMSALIAEVELAGAELGLAGSAESAPTRALPAREAALSSPSGSRRLVQQAAQAFKEWAEPNEAAVAAAVAATPADAGEGGGRARRSVPLLHI